MTQHIFDIFPAIHALTGATFYRLELGKLGFPEAQDVRRETAQIGHFANAEVKAFRDHNFCGSCFCRRPVLQCHRVSEISIRVSTTT